MAQAGSGRGDLRFRARWSLLPPVSPKDPLTAARIAVLAGDLLRSRIDPTTIQRAAAVLFIALGGLLLWQSFRAPPA